MLRASRSGVARHFDFVAQLVQSERIDARTEGTAKDLRVERLALLRAGLLRAQPATKGFDHHLTQRNLLFMRDGFQFSNTSSSMAMVVRTYAY